MTNSFDRHFPITSVGRYPGMPREALLDKICARRRASALWFWVLDEFNRLAQVFARRRAMVVGFTSSFDRHFPNTPGSRCFGPVWEVLSDGSCGAGRRWWGPGW